MTTLARVPAAAILAAAYVIAGATAVQFSRPEETVVAGLCYLSLVAYWRARGDDRLFWTVVFPLPAFVLFHEQMTVPHEYAFGPAALSIAIAWWADRAARSA